MEPAKTNSMKAIHFKHRLVSLLIFGQHGYLHTKFHLPHHEISLSE